MKVTHYLDRDIAGQSGIARSIDFTHPTRTEEGENLVSPEPRAVGQAHPSARIIPRHALNLSRHTVGERSSGHALP